MMKKVAISQSNYIPWRGYFDLIASVDEFVIFDEMQYTKRDWRNRNKIKTKDGSIWLTVPVKVKGKYLQKIRDTKIDGTKWRSLHWETIKSNYKKAPFFKDLSYELEQIYCKENHIYLSKLNRRIIDLICDYLKIKTKIRDSFEFHLQDDKNERLISICKELDASEYITGPTAQNYLNTNKFNNNNIKVSFINYSDYHQYNQLWGGFIDKLSILDLIFNCGQLCNKFMNHI